MNRSTFVYIKSKDKVLIKEEKDKLIDFADKNNNKEDGKVNKFDEKIRALSEGDIKDLEFTSNKSDDV